MKHILFAATFLAGCAAAPEYYRPTENVSAQSTTGAPAASYDVRNDSGRVAQVLVWSDGSWRAPVGGRIETLVDVGLEIRNFGNSPIELDSSDTRMEAVRVGQRLVSGAKLVSVVPVDGGDTTVPSGADRQFDLSFAVPQTATPTDVNAFRVRWSLLENGKRYLQFTPFVTNTSGSRSYYYAYVPVYGFYDPWFYDPFAPTFVVVHHYPVHRVVVVPHQRHYR